MTNHSYAAEVASTAQVLGEGAPLHLGCDGSDNSSVHKQPRIDEGATAANSQGTCGGEEKWPSLADENAEAQEDYHALVAISGLIARMGK